MNAERASLLIMNEKTGRFEIKALIGARGEPVEGEDIGGRVARVVFAKNEAVVVSDVSGCISVFSNEVSGAGIPLSVAAKMSEEHLSGLVSKFADEQNIHIVVAGSEAGKFSAAFYGWVTGPMGSISVSRKIET